MAYPSTVQIKKLATQHPDYKKNVALWERIRKLYVGGEDLRKSIVEFLYRRPAEKAEIYAARCNEATYINVLQAIIGWYISAEFKEAPTVVKRKEGWEDIKATGGTDALATLELDPKDKEFIDSFIEDCDGGGTDFTKWWKDNVESQVLLYQSVYIHVDLPDTGEKAYDSLGQQLQDGALRTRLKAFYPQDVINWAFDGQGNLEWLVIQATVTEQDGPLDDAATYDRWWLFDRKQVALYEYKRRPDERIDAKPPETSEATLKSVNPHALSDREICPFFVHRVTDDLWLGNRLSGPIVKYFNLSNAWDWALHQSNIAVLVAYSDQDYDTITKSETEFIQMRQGDTLAYLEPSGQGFNATADRVSEYREDIYRIAYLIDQGRSASSNASIQSGISKEQDKMPARDILSALGDNTRPAMQWLLQCVCDIAEAKIEIDIQGLDFKDRYDATELDFLIKAEFMDVASPTYKREKAKKLVRLVLPDSNRAIHDQFDQEIESNPLPEEFITADPGSTTLPSGTSGMTGQQPTRGQKAAATVSQAAKQTLARASQIKSIERMPVTGSTGE